MDVLVTQDEGRQVKVTEPAVPDVEVQQIVHGAPLSADFCTSDPTTWQYHAVQFYDLSTGDPTVWEWKVDDVAASAIQNPSLAFATTGAHTIALKATKSSRDSTETKADYVNVVTPDEWLLNAGRDEEQDCLRRNPENVTATRYAHIRFRIDECTISEDKDVARILELKDGAGNVMFAATLRRDTWTGQVAQQQDVSGLALTFTVYDGDGSAFAEREYPYDPSPDGQYVQPPFALAKEHWYWIKVKIVNDGASSAWSVYFGDDNAGAYQRLKVSAGSYGLIWSETNQDPGWTSSWGDVQAGIVEASHALQFRISDFDVSPSDITPTKPSPPGTRLMNMEMLTGGGWPLDCDMVRFWSQTFTGSSMTVAEGEGDYYSLLLAVGEGSQLKAHYLYVDVRPANNADVVDFHFHFCIKVNSNFVPRTWMDDLVIDQVDWLPEPGQADWAQSVMLHTYLFDNQAWPHFIVSRWDPEGSHPRAGEAFLYFFWEYEGATGTEIPGRYIYLVDDEWTAITHQVARSGTSYIGKFWRNGLYLPTHDQDGGAGSYPDAMGSAGHGMTHMEIGWAGNVAKDAAEGSMKIANCIVDTAYIAPNSAFVTVPDARIPRSGIFVSTLRDKDMACILAIHNNSGDARKAEVSIHEDGVAASFESEEWVLAANSPTEKDLKTNWSPASDYYIKVRILDSDSGDLVDSIPLTESFAQYSIFDIAPFAGAVEIMERPWPLHEVDRNQTCEAAMRMSRAAAGGFNFDDEMALFNATHESLVGESGCERTISISYETRGFDGTLHDSGSFNVAPLATTKLKASDLGVPANGAGVVFLTFEGSPKEFLAYFETTMLFNGDAAMSVAHIPWVTDDG